MSAATLFASTSLALGSLIGAWVGSTSNNVFESTFIYGYTGQSIISVKYVSLLFCFLVAFASCLQCIRSPCQFPYQYAKQWYPSWVCTESSDSWKCFLVSRVKGNLLCHHIAAVDIWSNSNVCFFSDYGGDFAHSWYKFNSIASVSIDQSES